MAQWRNGCQNINALSIDYLPLAALVHDISRGAFGLPELQRPFVWPNAKIRDLYLHTGQPDDKIQVALLKTLAAFLNAGGGTLLIGVSDDGAAVGLSIDGFPNEDKMSLHLFNLIRDRIGDPFVPYIHPEFIEHDRCRVLSVWCERAPKPAFV